LNEARKDHGTDPIVLDTSGKFYQRAEQQAKLSAQTGTPVHSTVMDGSESIAMYPYEVTWQGGQLFGNQAAIHAPGLMAANKTSVGICAVAYQHSIYVVFYSSAWTFD